MNDVTETLYLIDDENRVLAACSTQQIADDTLTIASTVTSRKLRLINENELKQLQGLK